MVDNKIGSLNEGSLHASLKSWYAEESDEIEKHIDGYIIDVIKDDQLIEIQTAGFSSIKLKMVHLAKNYPTKLVYPIAETKWLLKLPEEPETAPIRRKSPRAGTIFDLFDELVSFPELIMEDRFSIEIVFIVEEEVRKFTGNKSWRRGGWKIVDRKLIQVLGTLCLPNAAAFSKLLPENLTESFTTKELATTVGISIRKAQKMVYCLRKMNVIQASGKQGRYIVYTRSM